eukprot:556542_1
MFISIFINNQRNWNVKYFKRFGYKHVLSVSNGSRSNANNSLMNIELQLQPICQNSISIKHKLIKDLNDKIKNLLQDNKTIDMIKNKLINHDEYDVNVINSILYLYSICNNELNTNTQTIKEKEINHELMTITRN